MKPTIIAVILTLVSATAYADITNQCEAVMVEGMSISFTNSHGSMTVTAGKGFERRYTWAGDTRTVNMWPRKKRWYGSLGMYNPGAYITGELEQWKEHDGIKRYVVEEGQRHFTNATEAVAWTRRGSGAPDNLDYIYNDIAGARRLSGLGDKVGADRDPDFTFFVAIDSESDHLPVGEARQHWNPEVLRAKDAEVAKFEAFYREKAFEVCRRLIQKYERHDA